MKNAMFVILLFILVAPNFAAELLVWQLPVHINDDRYTVYSSIGIPNEIISAKTVDRKYIDWPEEKTNEIFYKYGLVVIFENDIVSGISINTYGSFKGWIDYKGEIINGLTLNDNRDIVIAKLGKPLMQKTDPLVAENKDNWGLIEYSNSYFMWETDTYDITIVVANSDQLIDDEKMVIRKMNEISNISISRIEKKVDP